MRKGQHLSTFEMKLLWLAISNGVQALRERFDPTTWECMGGEDLSIDLVVESLENGGQGLRDRWPRRFNWGRADFPDKIAKACKEAAVITFDDLVTLIKESRDENITRNNRRTRRNARRRSVRR